MERLPNNPLINWIKNRIKRNKNVIIICNGATGSGKTYAMLSLAEQIAKELGTNFNVKDNMDFNFAGLLKKTMLPVNDKPGTVFLFEEVGSFTSGSSARTWQSKSNQFFFSFMQTTRHRRQILLMTCPNFSFLERGARSLVHMQCEMDGIDARKKVSYARPYKIQVNPRTGNFYFKYLRVSYKGNRFKLKRVEFELPEEELCKDYEKLKGKFTADLNKEIIDKADEKKVDKRFGSKINDQKIQELLAKGVTRTNMAKIFECHPKTITRHIKDMELEHKSTIKPIIP